MDDVYVTGLGVVCCLGTGVDRFWRGMAAARSSPVPTTDPYAHVTVPLLYAVPSKDRPGADSGWGSTTHLAVAAAEQAVADAGLSLTARDGMAVVVGTGMGDADRHETWRLAGFPQDDRWIPGFAVGSTVAGRLGATGAVITVSNACAAGGCAVSMAADLVRTGEATVAVAVGAEAYSRVALACFDRLGALDPRECRPFSRDRRGTVFGEGAAALVLESAAQADRRPPATRYARLAGAGWSCDAYHPTAPEPDGTQIVRAMVAALAEAGATADQLGCLVPHGTGTELNDRTESEAVHTALGARAVDLPLYSLKALIGHTGGAAGAMAAVAATLIVHHGTVPGNVPLGEQDPDCKVWLPMAAVPVAGRFTMLNAYAFGGNNISLVLERAA